MTHSMRTGIYGPHNHILSASIIPGNYFCVVSSKVIIQKGVKHPNFHGVVSDRGVALNRRAQKDGGSGSDVCVTLGVYQTRRYDGFKSPQTNEVSSVVNLKQINQLTKIPIFLENNLNTNALFIFDVPDACSTPSPLV